MIDTPEYKGDKDAHRNENWGEWYEELRLMSIREQAGIIEYPDLADRALESSNSFKRLISSEKLLKDLKIALMQAWPSVGKNGRRQLDARCSACTIPEKHWRRSRNG